MQGDGNRYRMHFLAVFDCFPNDGCKFERVAERKHGLLADLTKLFFTISRFSFSFRSNFVSRTSVQAFDEVSKDEYEMY